MHVEITMFPRFLDFEVMAVICVIVGIAVLTNILLLVGNEKVFWSLFYSSAQSTYLLNK